MQIFISIKLLNFKFIEMLGGLVMGWFHLLEYFGTAALESKTRI
jgi:hypothetical protein